MKTVWFRGRPTCTCMPKWVVAFENELIRRKYRPKGWKLHIYQLTGGAAASAGTHSQGGAIDCIPLTRQERLIARAMGCVMSLRTPSQGFMLHEHGVLNGCRHNGPARYQVDAIIKRRRNGLGAGGNGGVDGDPRPKVWRTWSAGIRWAKSKELWTLKVMKTDVKVYKGAGVHTGTVKNNKGQDKILKVGQTFRTRGKMKRSRPGSTIFHIGINGGFVPNRNKNLKRVA